MRTSTSHFGEIGSTLTHQLTLLSISHALAPLSTTVSTDFLLLFTTALGTVEAGKQKLLNLSIKANETKPTSKQEAKQINE